MGEQKASTEVAQGQYNPIWNEIFSFDIETGSEVLDIEMFSQGGVGGDSSLGAC